MKTAIKVGLAIVPTGFAILAGWYLVDRVFIEKVPLYPFSLKKAKEKKATAALAVSKKKLTRLMDENKIHAFGTVFDAETKKNYIEVKAQKITAGLKGEIPASVNGVEIRLVEAPVVKVQ
jgi:hypothetical protein